VLDDGMDAAASLRQAQNDADRLPLQSASSPSAPSAP